MSESSVIVWFMGAGFTVNFSALLLIRHAINNRMDRLEVRMEKFDEKLTDIDRRLCRLEGSFSSRDWHIKEE